MEQMDFSIEVSESEIEKFADYLYQKENAKATINKYMADIKKFLSFLADDKRINKKVLLQYKEWLVQKYAVNSVNSMLACMNSVPGIFECRKSESEKNKSAEAAFFTGSERSDRKRMQEIDCNSYGRRKRTACIVY